MADKSTSSKSSSSKKKSEEEAADVRLSSQAQFATYESNADVSGQVVQTLGQPSK